MEKMIFGWKNRNKKIEKKGMKGMLLKKIKMPKIRLYSSVIPHSNLANISPHKILAIKKEDGSYDLVQGDKVIGNVKPFTELTQEQVERHDKYLQECEKSSWNKYSHY